MIVPKGPNASKQAKNTYRNNFFLSKIHKREHNGLIPKKVVFWQLFKFQMGILKMDIEKYVHFLKMDLRIKKNEKNTVFSVLKLNGLNYFL